MRKYVVEARDMFGDCRASGTFVAGEPGEAMWDAQVVMRPSGISSYAVYRPSRLRRRRLVLVAAASGGSGGDADGGFAGVREPRRPKPGPGHLSAALDPPV